MARAFALFLLLPALVVSLVVSGTGCTSAYKSSLGGDTETTFSRIYRTDFNTAWQSVLDGLKNSRLDVSNREAGYILTKWTDNTAEKNMIDSYGSADAYLKAQYRFRVTVAQGSFDGSPSAKVAVIKEQVVSRDVLEGFRPIATDMIEEKTLLYRIGRIIFMRMKLALIEERRTKSEIEASGGHSDSPADSTTPPAPDGQAPAPDDLANDPELQ
jgi:hypothetical protein